MKRLLCLLILPAAAHAADAAPRGLTAGLDPRLSPQPLRVVQRAPYVEYWLR
jgi:hypothetical protein